MVVKNYILVGLLFLSISYGRDFSEKDILKESIEKTDYTALLKVISYTILNDLKSLPDLNGTCDNFDYIETYEVLKTYKGKLPKYIIVKKTGEYCEKFHLEQYGINQEKITIGSLIKKNNYYYFPEFEYQFRDSIKLRKFVKETIGSE